MGKKVKEERRYPLDRIKRIMCSNLVETDRTYEEVQRQIYGMEDDIMDAYSENKIEVLLGASTSFEERESYENNFDDETGLDDNGEEFDPDEADAIEYQCEKAEQWLRGEIDDDLFSK